MGMTGQSQGAPHLMIAYSGNITHNNPGSSIFSQKNEQSCKQEQPGSMYHAGQEPQSTAYSETRSKPRAQVHGTSSADSKGDTHLDLTVSDSQWGLQTSSLSEARGHARIARCIVCPVCCEQWSAGEATNDEVEQHLQRCLT